MDYQKLVLKSRAFLGGKIAKEECLPEILEEGKKCLFSVSGEVSQGENIPLYEQTVTGELKQVAVVDIEEVTHTRRYGRKWSFGSCRIKKVLRT